MRVFALVIVALAAVVSAQTNIATVTHTALLTAEQAGTTATTFGVATLNLNGNTVTFSITHNIPTLSNAHFHGAHVGQTGSPVAAFAPTATNGQLNFTDQSGLITGTGTLSNAEVLELNDGGYYINLHTAANPSGEIRGQVVPAGTQVALLNGGNAGSGSAFTGAAKVTATASTFQLYLFHDVTGVTDIQVLNSLGSTMFSFASIDNDAVTTGTPPYISPAVAWLSTAQRTSFFDGGWTVIVLTAANPNGEIQSGELNSNNDYVANINNAQQTATVTDQVSIDAQGNAIMSYHPTTRTLRVSLVHNLPQVSNMHIHGPAAAGTTAGVLVNFTPLDFVQDTYTIDADTETHIANQLTYVNVHNTPNPGGAIRGQIRPPVALSAASHVATLSVVAYALIAAIFALLQ